MSQAAVTRGGNLPTRLNLVLATLLVGLHLYVYLALPLVVVDWELHSIAPVLLLLLATNAYWALIHEAIHGLLYPVSAVNNRLGRLLSVCYGSQFRMLRFGHLLHHRQSRHNLDPDGSYDPGHQSALNAGLRHYGHLFGGLYVAELLSNIAAWLPRSLLEKIAAQSLQTAHDGLPGQQTTTRAQLLSPHGLRELRLDGLATVLLLGVSFWLYGEHWPILALLLAGRGLIISLTDSSFHYQPPRAAEQGSMNFSVLPLLRPLVLNFNLHRVHHRHPGEPWTRLSRLYESDGDHIDYAWSHGLLRQLRGVVPRPGTG